MRGYQRRIWLREIKAIRAVTGAGISFPKVPGPCPPVNPEKRYKPAFSRRHEPEVCKNLVPLMTEGAGKAGCPKHPQPVRIGSKHTVVTTSTPEITRLSPRDGFTGFLRALPGDEFLLSPSSRGLTALREARSGSQNLHGLDISNGCQDHTTSPYAATSTNVPTGHVQHA
jgi:hypothetical protein